MLEKQVCVRVCVLIYSRYLYWSLQALFVQVLGLQQGVPDPWVVLWVIARGGNQINIWLYFEVFLKTHINILSEVAKVKPIFTSQSTDTTITLI